MTEPFKIAEAYFKDCQVVHEFLNTRVRARLPPIDVKDESQLLFHGMFLRALGWFRTLYKLNEPADFQAVIVGSRALFEIVVDLTLLHFNPQNTHCSSCRRMGTLRQIQGCSSNQAVLRR